MAYDGWVEYNGVEIINLSRTAQLAVGLDIDVVWAEPESVAWIEAARGETNYDQINTAPWYDPGYPASAEFVGVVPLSLAGLDNSTLETSSTEYITDGGSSGKARNSTLAIVANVAFVASTERGADYGKRWLDRVLRGGGARSFCAGSEMHYFQWEGKDSEPVPPVVHRRDVSLSRGTSVTRKRSTYCSAVWLATFTLTANDPFEYGEEVERFIGLGGVVQVPSDDPGAVYASGSLPMTEESCPAYDYSPIYDPLYPALVAPPTAPDFYPEGWSLIPGVNFTRHWARVLPVEPSEFSTVPVVRLTTSIAARMVRVSVWPESANEDAQCEPLWSVIMTYVPVGLNVMIDGEQRAVYTWDGFSPVVRRADSLAFGPGARPLRWDRISNGEGLLVTLDVLSGTEYSDSVRAALTLVPKSD